MSGDTLPGAPRRRPRLMAVHAHPDDESSKGAATMAKYAAEGADVLVVTCTGGERGSLLNPRFPRPRGRVDMGALRAAEMERARRILGVRQCWLGYRDSGLPGEGEPLPADCFARADPAAATARLVALMRWFRPHVVTTYDEDGGYPHPDHVMAHRVTVAAFASAADGSAHPLAGPPWQPLKLYYNHGSHPARSAALHRALRERGSDAPYAPLPNEPVRQPEITTRVPCAGYFPVRDRALLAHASQVDPDGVWFAVPTALQQEVWPTEDYTLARSLVPVRLPESDLFAGIEVAARAAHPEPSRPVPAPLAG
ncbi:mycothiol conjugate amidase Mca [Streptomyces sp. NPDC028635]|uniref:mycothiol conjugate amidase Mca n=1 Tax=Streptomyces sp. NPDC028635 TaxID=3154800 RepID=UPI0033CF55F8